MRLFPMPLQPVSVGLEDFEDDIEELDDIFNAGPNLPQDGNLNIAQIFMLDLLDNLPRLRLSDDQLKMILWIMRECNTPDVPSFTALRKKQATLAKDVNIKTEHHVSMQGNEFSRVRTLQILLCGHTSNFIRSLVVRFLTATSISRNLPSWKMDSSLCPCDGSQRAA